VDTRDFRTDSLLRPISCLSTPVHALYFASVVLHVLAAITWIGGMFFLMLVVVPWLRGRDRASGAAFLRETGMRFRTVGWVCFAILLVTGTFNLWMRGVRLSSFTDALWLASPFGKAVLGKLATFSVVLAVSAVHDFFHGPQATRAVMQDPTSAEAERFRRRASLLGRLNAVFALLLVFFAVALVRGFPF
jgi:copper resistance protein D